MGYTHLETRKYPLAHLQFKFPYDVSLYTSTMKEVK